MYGDQNLRAKLRAARQEDEERTGMLGDRRPRRNARHTGERARRRRRRGHQGAAVLGLRAAGSVGRVTAAAWRRYSVEDSTWDRRQPTRFSLPRCGQYAQNLAVSAVFSRIGNCPPRPVAAKSLCCTRLSFGKLFANTIPGSNTPAFGTGGSPIGRQIVGRSQHPGSKTHRLCALSDMVCEADLATEDTEENKLAADCADCRR